MSIIYQIFPNSYTQEKNKFQVIENNLPKLKELRIDYLYLSPIFQTHFIDSGYDIDNYYELNLNFGTKKDFAKLVKAAKELEIEIILDITLNHTSDKHKWFELARKGDKKYQDFYILKSKKNNWVSSKTGKSMWSKFDEERYYLHNYSPEQPDLNWANKDLRNELANILNYWIDFGIKGFRLDVINKIGKPTSFVNVEEEYADYLFEHSEQGFKYIKELHGNLKEDVLLIGQTGGANEEQVKEYENAGIDYCLTFKQIDFLKKGYFYPTNEDKNLVFSYLNEIQRRKNPLLFLENHDSPRLVSVYTNDQEETLNLAKLLNAMLIISPGATIIYQGQEYAQSNYTFQKIEEMKDIRSKNFYEQREKNNESPEEIIKDFNLYSREHARGEIKINQEFYKFIKQLTEMRKDLSMDTYEFSNFRDDNGLYTISFKQENKTITLLLNNTKVERVISNKYFIYWRSTKEESKEKLTAFEIMIKTDFQR